MAQPSDSHLTEMDSRSASETLVVSAALEAAEREAELDAGAAPYGTRSRNRTGNARPNYAEDKDLDVEMFDFDHSGQKKSARQSTGVIQETVQKTTSSRKSLGDEPKGTLSQLSSKEQNSSSAPGVNSASQPSNGATQTSRKRKATTTTQQQNGVSSAASAAPSTRRAANGATQISTGLCSTSSSSSASWQTNMMTFTNSKARPQIGRLVADDGTVLEPNDHVYLVCEPPGEPYYLARIMEFLHQGNDTSKPVDAVRVNWFYRPKDIGRKVHDTRVVFATMHSDINPLTALRGKCQIKHRSQIDDIEAYRRTPDSFWFEKLYDRYIQKNYDLIPTNAIVNVPEKVKKVLDERWKFVLVEQGRGKELTSAVKSCKRCSGYCASNESVDCAVCQNTYHMHCVKPPLLKKPSRGFAWSCAACSRAQERKLEARHTPNVLDPWGSQEDEEIVDEEEEDHHLADTERNSSNGDEENHHQGTAEQVHQASLWPWRYLGMHCKPEDALDYDDRIYPRASTRIGPRHQANVLPWPGQPVQYVKPPGTKKNGKKDLKLKEAQEADQIPRNQRPPWMQDMPPGYLTRGEDPIDNDEPNVTGTVLWKPPISEERGQDVQAYMTEARGMGKQLGLPERSTNLQDIALETLYREDYNSDKATKALTEVKKSKFKEPILTANEQKKFEEGVSKFGSELYQVKKLVKTMTPGQVVRYYYTWKKTEKGKQVWSNFPGRKGKKEAKRAEAAASKVTDDVADADDDSAFDSGKAAEKKRNFMCQFCSTTTSRRWRRSPNAIAGLVNENGVKASSKDKGTPQYVVALCARCAELWRRYAIRWEDVEEMSKKVAAAGGRAWKRRQDEELLKELHIAREMGVLTPELAVTPINGTPASNGSEPPRKKLKGAPDKDGDQALSDGGTPTAVVVKKKEPVPEAPIIIEMPKPRVLPCAICAQLEPLGDQHVSCRECRLTVHRNCYGIMDTRSALKWTCDMCLNDKNPQVSIHYKCVLCPVEFTEQELVEQPKLTHHRKKMTDRDREREKLEVQQARKAVDEYKKKQHDLNRPVNPREPLKRTADNNWVHVTCAVWTPEVKFGNAKAMEPSEGIPSIPRAKYEETCQVCSLRGGACIPCQHCRAPYHVECARQQGHVLGFEVTPIKSSRRDQFHIVTLNGESGAMSAGLWCKDHVPTKINVHYMHDAADEPGLNALQLYAQNFKQADHTLTGTVRKANLMMTAARTSGTVLQSAHRRASLSTNGHVSLPEGSLNEQYPGDKVCISCGIDISPRWWPISINDERVFINEYVGSLGEEARKFVEQRKVQCHKCHKAHRTPRPPISRPTPSASADLPPAQPVDQMVQAPAVSVLRSPPTIHAGGNFREPRSAHQGWPPGHPGPPAPVQTMNGLPPAPTQIAGSGAPVQGYATAPMTVPQPPLGHSAPRAPYTEWSTRPTSGHGSPPRHLNGPPTVMQNGAPGGNMSALRPPALSGGPPGAVAIPLGHHHTSVGPPAYVNGLPPSPQRNAGPTPPSPYIGTFATGINHGPPPPTQGHPSHHPSLHGAHQMSNGVPPPRPEGYPPPPQSSGLHAPRGPYPTSNGPHMAHGSPPLRHGMPPAMHEQTSPGGPPTSMNGGDYRPPTGASASPSLRNLLS